MALIDVIPGHAAAFLAMTIPGYFLTLAFFTPKKSVSRIERFVLSILLSISSIPLLLLLENQLLLIPINSVSVIGTIALIIIFGLIVYFMRLRKIGVPEKIEKILPEVKEEEAFPLNPFSKK